MSGNSKIVDILLQNGAFLARVRPLILRADHGTVLNRFFSVSHRICDLRAHPNPKISCGARVSEAAEAVRWIQTHLHYRRPKRLLNHPRFVRGTQYTEQLIACNVVGIRRLGALRLHCSNLQMQEMESSLDKMMAHAVLFSAVRVWFGTCVKSNESLSCLLRLGHGIFSFVYCRI